MTVSNNLKTVSKLALLKIALYLDRTEDAENLLDSSKLKTINTNNWEKQMLYALNNKDRDFKILIFFFSNFFIPSLWLGSIRGFFRFYVDHIIWY